jgi:Protein of unknown function (DUF2795)
MSMMNTAADWGATPDTYFGQKRSRISWGAVLAGAVVSVATSLLLSLLGAAMGAGSIHALSTSTDPAHYGAGAAIWAIINLALSMAAGGYVAARLSGTHSHLDAELHGITMWGMAVLLGSVLLAQAGSGLLGIVGHSVSSVVNRAVGGATINPPDPRAMIDRLEQSLGSIDDPTAMSREQISAEISALVGRNLNGSLPESDRNRLIALVAAQSGVTKEEAARRVMRMENDAKASLAQAEQRDRAAADEVAHGTATAARALFTALVLGLLGALLGAWIGTRHKRVLHPAVDATRTFYETGGTFDDTGHVVSQYLRSVSFPVDKQDLLRLARSGNAGSGLLHWIEGMPERSYANADDVLRALGTAH